MLSGFKKDFSFTLPAPVILTGAGLFFLFIIAFWSSHTDLVYLWETNETYSHGYIIPIIAAILIYRQNDRLKKIALSPSPVILLPLTGSLLLWFLAVITDTKVVELTLLPLIFLFAYASMIGIQASWLVLAGIAYLFYAVPVWNLIIPLLQNIATFVNELALKLIGLPIYIEGTTVTTPAGSFEIEGGCSGVRYLIVTLALGSYYGLTHYKRARTIAILLAFSVLLPAISNWIRIYIIILAGHYSDMQSSLVSDHVWFGWVLYGISLIPLFFIAQYLQNKETAIQTVSGNQQSRTEKKLNVLLFLLPVILIVSASVFTNILKNSSAEAHLSIETPAATSPWIGPIYSNGWKPNYHNASIEKNLLYLGQDNQPDIGLHIYYYAKQNQDSELINELNTITDYHHIKQSQIVNYHQQSINENIIDVPAEGKLLVWFWFNVNNKNLAKPVVAKLYQALEKINGKTTSSLIALSLKCSGQCDEERDTIKLFLDQHIEKITKSLKM